ncbi:Down syndrome cell adhesion molecule homolog [Ixodes scapularis]
MVVHHVYKPQVYDEFVISGNVAVLRCSVPSFVREFVDFVSWHRDDGLAITRTSNRVVHHVYKPQVYDEFVISGNVAVLRCSVPSFVREFVDFVSWHRDDGLAITRTSNRGKYSVLPTGELYIRNAGPSDRLGSYHCKTKHRLTGEVVTSASSGRLIIQGIIAIIYGYCVCYYQYD